MGEIDVLDSGVLSLLHLHRLPYTVTYAKLGHKDVGYMRCYALQDVIITSKDNPRFISNAHSVDCQTISFRSMG